MDRHARSPPPVFRRVWRENAPLSRLSRLSPSTAGHESRGGGPKTPLLLPSPPYCRAVLSRQSWPRNAISMGFFWGACAEAAIIPASPPGPSSPLFSDGHSILSLSFSLSRDNFSRNFSLSRWELEFYIYSIDEEFVNREREIERVAWSISELIYSYDWFLFTFYWEGEEGGDVDQGGWSLEAIASGPRHGGIRKVRDRPAGQVDSPPPPPLSFYHVSLGNGARARACVEAAEGRCPLATSTTSFAYSRRRAPRKGWKGGRGTDTTANRPSPPSRPLVRGDRKEPTLLLPAPLLLSLSTLQAA